MSCDIERNRIDHFNFKLDNSKYSILCIMKKEITLLPKRPIHEH